MKNMYDQIEIKQVRRFIISGYIEGGEKLTSFSTFTHVIATNGPSSSQGCFW